LIYWAQGEFQEVDSGRECLNTPQEQMRTRTKEIAVRIVKLFRALPKMDEARILGRQLLRSGTSVAANYRAAGRARSRAEFAAKIGVAVEEADETIFWLELLVKAHIGAPERIKLLLGEAKELLAVLSASQRTARSPKRPSTDGPITRSPDFST